MNKFTRFEDLTIADKIEHLKKNDKLFNIALDVFYNNQSWYNNEISGDLWRMGLELDSYDRYFFARIYDNPRVYIDELRRIRHDYGLEFTGNLEQQLNSLADYLTDNLRWEYEYLVDCLDNCQYEIFADEQGVLYDVIGHDIYHFNGLNLKRLGA